MRKDEVIEGTWVRNGKIYIRYRREDVNVVTSDKQINSLVL